ncbi:MAG: cytochrome c peroxidase [Ferrimonas sp.]
MVAGRSRYDVARAKSANAIVDFDYFSEQENWGKRLFFIPRTLDNGEQVHCAGCHTTEAFVGPLLTPPFSTSNASNNGLDLLSTNDLGVYETTGNPNDVGKFKVPSLVNIAVTAPYMHDARFATLEEVIAHYSQGIQNHNNLAPPLRGPNDQALQFNFSEAEAQALRSFLHTLTDHALLTDERVLDPFIRAQ